MPSTEGCTWCSMALCHAAAAVPARRRRTASRSRCLLRWPGAKSAIQSPPPLCLSCRALRRQPPPSLAEPLLYPGRPPLNRPTKVRTDPAPEHYLYGGCGRAPAASAAVPRAPACACMGPFCHQKSDIWAQRGGASHLAAAGVREGLAPAGLGGGCGLRAAGAARRRTRQSSALPPLLPQQEPTNHEEGDLRPGGSAAAGCCGGWRAPPQCCRVQAQVRRRLR